MQFITDRGYAVPHTQLDKSGNSSQEKQDSTNEDSDHTSLLLDSSQEITCTPNSSQEQLPVSAKKLKHSDPLDDSIFSKRFGKNTFINTPKTLQNNKQI